jgi:hypothetical protein
MRIRSRPVTSFPSTENSGEVSCITQVIDSSNRMRVTMAKPRPRRRPMLRCSGGRRPTRIEMKMMLSTPSTISSATRVMRAIQPSGVDIQANHSIQCLLGSVRTALLRRVYSVIRPHGKAKKRQMLLY